MAIPGKATDQSTEARNTDRTSDPAADSMDAFGADPEETRATPTSKTGEPAREDRETSQPEYERLKTERDQLLDRVARLQAEFENARKREARERADFRDFALARAIEQFLPVIDNFQLALKSSGSVEQLRGGVELIVKQMEDALRSLNVQPVETVGVKFDPRVHEALDSVERHDLPDHQILEEVRRGYRIRDRLLRPALVRIVNNPEQKEA